MQVPTSVRLSNRVARLNDIPYYTTKEMQFTFTQTATLALGVYPFDTGRAVMTGAKNFTGSTLILIRNISFSADISILNYQASLQLTGGTVNIPVFHTFLASGANVPILRNPILLRDYFTNQTYILALDPRRKKDQLNAFFRGTLQQTAALAGISQINLTFTIYANEINDNEYIKTFKKGYRGSLSI